MYLKSHLPQKYRLIKLLTIEDIRLQQANYLVLCRLLVTGLTVLTFSTSCKKTVDTFPKIDYRTPIKDEHFSNSDTIDLDCKVYSADEIIYIEARIVDASNNDLTFKRITVGSNATQLKTQLILSNTSFASGAAKIEILVKTEESEISFSRRIFLEEQLSDKEDELIGLYNRIGEFTFVNLAGDTVEVKNEFSPISSALAIGSSIYYYSPEDGLNYLEKVSSQSRNIVPKNRVYQFYKLIQIDKKSIAFCAQIDGRYKALIIENGIVLNEINEPNNEILRVLKGEDFFYTLERLQGGNLEYRIAYYGLNTGGFIDAQKVRIDKVQSLFTIPGKDEVFISGNNPSKQGLSIYGFRKNQNAVVEHDFVNEETHFLPIIDQNHGKVIVFSQNSTYQFDGLQMIEVANSPFTQQILDHSSPIGKTRSAILSVNPAGEKSVKIIEREQMKLESTISVSSHIVGVLYFGASQQ